MPAMKRTALLIGGVGAFSVAFWFQDSFWNWLGFGIPWWGYVVFWGPIVAYVVWLDRSKSN